MEDKIELIKEVATLKANQQNMYEQQNNTLSKIESLVESNYAVVGSVEMLTRQLSDYGKKVDDQAVLLNDVVKDTNEKITRYEKRVDTLETDVLQNIYRFESNIKDIKSDDNDILKRVEALEQYVESEKQKGYNLFKGFFKELFTKTQNAVILFIIGLLAIFGRDVVDYFIQLLQKSN